MKTCSKCKQIKPATTEYFVRDKNHKDGLKVNCKECDRQYYLANREKICLKSKEYRENHKEYVLQVGAEYRKKNREKLQAYFKEYNKKHSDKKRAYRERTREHHNQIKKEWDAKNKEHCRLYYLRYKEEKGDEIKQRRLEMREKLNERSRKYNREHPEAKKASQHKYFLNNRDKVRAQKHIRKAREKNLLKNLTVQEWREGLKFFDNQCAYCGRIEETLHQEHVIPVAKDGHYICSNIIPACKSCNCSKQDRDLFDWYPKQEFFDPKKLKKIQQWTGYTEQIQQCALF